jgi:hypothetical protein
MKTIECISCFNENTFKVLGIERISEDRRLWNVCFKCMRCATQVSNQFAGFEFEWQLRSELKKLLGEHKRRNPMTSYIEFEYLTGKLHYQTDNIKRGLYKYL